MASERAGASSGEAGGDPMDVDISDDDMGNILEKTWDARTKWYFIGVRFNLKVSDLDVIDNSSKDDDEKFRKMIKLWLNNDNCCTWRAVHDALKHCTVGQNAIAEKLKEWLATRPAEGIKRKRKATPVDDVLMKKVKLDEVSTTTGPLCPSKIKFAATAHNDCAYFANENEVHEFNVPSKEWKQSYKCPQNGFGLAAIENELILVGGLVEDTDSVTNKIQSLNLSTSNEQNMWEEKYPVMATARVGPEVVVSGRYLIVLGGRTHPSVAINSVEVLDLEQKCWFSNDKISLPEEFTTMKWQSACICGKHLFIAVKHDDPKFEENIPEYYDDEEKDSFGDPKSPIDPGDPYPCFSLYRCNVETLLQMAQEKATEDGASVMKTTLWQQLKHPHPSVYKSLSTVLKMRNDFPYDCDDDDDDDDKYPYTETEYFHYGSCAFTLSCINDDKLIAVGCKHIESTKTNEVKASLKTAYSDYWCTERLRDKELYNCYDIPDEDCHIYLYNMNNDSWEVMKCVDLKSEGSFARPSVAVVKDKIIFLRDSNTTHIVTLPTS